MKNLLDDLNKKYETVEFIKNDPIQFAHRYSKKEDIEIAAFVSSLMAYGRREAFIKKLDALFASMENGPYEFVLDYKSQEHLLNGYIYRFVKDVDMKALFYSLNVLYGKGETLETLFSQGVQCVSDFFYKCATNVSCEAGMGFYHLLPNPKSGGAQKRFNMFLRWMIRKGPVDLGLWSFMDKSQLLIPLDVHVGNVSRSLFLLQRRCNDFKAVCELTAKLREFDSHDPVKYDFSLFGAGIDKALLHTSV